MHNDSQGKFELGKHRRPNANSSAVSNGSGSVGSVEEVGGSHKWIQIFAAVLLLAILLAQFTVTPANAFRIPAGAAVDLAGINNAEEAGADILDKKPPIVTLAGPATYTDTTEFTLTVTLDEDVQSPPIAGNFSIKNNNAAIGTLSGSGRDYTIAITPDGSGGSIEVVFAAGAVSDGNNSNVESTFTINDADSPTVSITSPTEYTSTDGFNVTVTFSEPVNGFGTDAGDVTFENNNGTWSLFSGADGDSVYTITVTPNDDVSGSIGFRIPASRKQSGHDLLAAARVTPSNRRAAGPD